MVRVVSLSPEYPLSRTDRSFYGWNLVPPAKYETGITSAEKKLNRQRRWKERKKIEFGRDTLTAKTLR